MPLDTPALRYCVFLLLSSIVLPGPSAAHDDFPEPVNTQAPGEHPPSPREMLDLFELPPGFEITLFAGEPDVQQPIAFDFDDRGRIWVAENYTYSARGKIDPNLRDRVIILEDHDGDGEHDERKVFWDKGRMLTGLTWGYGGLWILNDGNLSFIPDRDEDDVPDSEPIVMLNGWTKGAGHNFVNGLMWGPDGWLYGRHGITDTSLPGTPDTPDAEREPINCGIWKFHPTRHDFEVVCNGTTNPWGLDYNDRGDLFMSNNVIGHLWHVIPGAHYERMFGQDFNPHLYDLMEQCADHYHWDNTGKWSDSRDGKASDLGGGHSHCGLMIYQGQNFPKQYHGRAFMCNTHGRCVNVDRLERQGASYVGRHEDNFLKVNSPWFRGVTIASGPAGCVYLSDWSDNGECHDHDGVHRTSGRIYRISYGTPVITPVPDLQNQKLTLLAHHALSPDSSGEWLARHAYRVLLERYPHASEEDQAALDPLRDGYWSQSGDEGSHGVRTASLFFALDAFRAEDLQRALLAPNEVVRRMALEYVCSDPELLNQYHGLIDQWIFNHEESPTVLMTYASAVQRYCRTQENAGDLPFPSYSGMLKLCRICGQDTNLQRMTWYALQQFNACRDPNHTVPLSFIRDGKVRSYQARWMASQWKTYGDEILRTIEDWPQVLATSDDDRFGVEDPVADTRLLLEGILTGLEGQILPQQSIDWATVREQYGVLGDQQINALVSRLSATFGSPEALQRLRTVLQDRDGDHAIRSKAVEALAARGDEASLPLFIDLLNDRAVYADIARGLAQFDDPRVPEALLKRWNNLRHGSREAATDTLCSRHSYALELVKAIDTGRISSDVLTAAQVRQLTAFGDPKITSVIEKHWGVINNSSEAKAAAIAAWKTKLTPEYLEQGDRVSGAALFKKTCAACHRLYGEGGTIGPDLTGANRGNVDYLLGNIVNPSEVVPKQFTVSVIVLTSGRLVNGVVVGETDSTITVQTDKDKLVIARSDIEEQARTNRSLMPDGLLESMKPNQVRDLFAFLMHRK